MRALRIAIVLSVMLSFSPHDSLSTRLFPSREASLPCGVQTPRLSLLTFRNARPSECALAERGEGCCAAVLKFICAQKKQDREWLACELADSLVRKLTAFLDLEYCDPAAIPFFEDGRDMAQGGRIRKARIASLARRMKADLVVVGSYSYDGDTIRADIQAMRPSTGAVSAPLHFECSAERICYLEEEMAVSVAELLGRRLSGHEKEKLAECPTRSAVAFEEFCKGRQASEGSYSKIQHFQKAIAADPGCVEARYLLGNAYCEIGATYRYSEWFNMAIDEYGKAAAVAPNCAKIHCAMGVACMMRGRYDCARKSLERALEIEPDMKSAKGYLLRLETMGF